jgi:hypothetical protein
LADAWSVYDNSGKTPKVSGKIPVKRKRKSKSRLQTSKEFSDAVGRALRRAAKMARKTARMHGTPIYIWKDGKVVAEKP